MKKLKVLPFLFLSFFAVMFGFYGCGGAEDNVFWVTSQVSVLNFLDVDTYTPIENITTPAHYLTWIHTEGYTYKIKAKVEGEDQTLLKIAGGGYELSSGKQVKTKGEPFGVKIPAGYADDTTIFVTYSTPAAPTVDSMQYGVYRRILFDVTESVDFYEISFNEGSNLFNNKDNVYDGTNVANPDTASQNFNTFAPANSGTSLVFRTPATIAGDRGTENYVYGASQIYAVHLTDDENFTAFTRYLPAGSSDIDSSLTSIFGTSKGAQRLTNAIQGKDDLGALVDMGGKDNVYSFLEEKYLTLIRSCFIPLQAYSPLLGSQPKGVTDSNGRDYEYDFKEFEKETEKVRNILKTICKTGADFARMFEGEADFITADFLSGTDTPKYSGLTVFEEKLTTYMETMVGYAEKTQEFFEKYYGVNPDVSSLDLTIRKNSTEYNTSGKKSYAENVEELFTKKTVTSATVKNKLVAYEVSLLRPVYEFYFKAHNGRYNKLSDRPLFEELYRICDDILVKTTTSAENKTNRNIWDELLVYDRLHEYVERERENLLTAIEMVNHLAIVEVERRSDAPDGTFAWAVENSYKGDYFIQISYKKTGNIVKVVNIFNFFTEKEKQLNQWRIKESDITAYLVRNYGAWETDESLTRNFSVLKIDSDSINKAYYDRITTYLYEGIPTLKERTGFNHLGGLLVNSPTQTLYIEDGKYYVPKN